MPDLREAKTEGGRFIYSEAEIGKVSELKVKWYCFAGRVQNAGGSSPKAARNSLAPLSPQLDRW